MTLKEELEILRGEPIQVWEGDPKDIPCIETSDPELLCKHPVVSVHMITYNHEPYIREAIEGVMMQKTDFEFELVIGEDCSTDRTREICFEYQKKYPDKIRVLWWHKNSYKFPHPAGGNSRRNLAHCRGEFIAICEGDDYWIDPLKLQKQVDVMRKYPNVGLCFTNGRDYSQSSGMFLSSVKERFYTPGVIEGKKFALTMTLGRDPRIGPGPESTLMTASVLLRKSDLINAIQRYDIFDWKLHLGDLQTWLGIGFNRDVCFMPQEMVVYRVTDTGACHSLGPWVAVDVYIVRSYFLKKVFGVSPKDIPISYRQDFAAQVLAAFWDHKNFPQFGTYWSRLGYLFKSLCNETGRSIFFTLPSVPITLGLFTNILPKAKSVFVVSWRRACLFYVFRTKACEALGYYYDLYYPEVQIRQLQGRSSLIGALERKIKRMFGCL